MGIWGIIILLGGALLLGVIEQTVGRARSDKEWLYDAIAAVVGGFIGSELLGAASAWGPQVDGLFIFPALLGAIVVSVITELVIRNRTATHA